MDGNNHSIFVHGLTEVEIKFMRELLEVFCKDRKRKWLSYTMKNTKCGDSTVFTILLVQPCTPGEAAKVKEYRRTVCVDELPLSLSSSENSTGDNEQCCKKLDEAAKVKDASITLKPRLEITKPDHTDSRSELLPYCQSRSVQLLQNFFDEEDKTVYSRGSHQDEESLMHKGAKYFHREEEPLIDPASGLVYSLGPPFPLLMLNCRQSENSHKDLIRFLDLRLTRIHQLARNLHEKRGQFRTRLIETQKENDLFTRQIHSYKEELDKERENVNSLESKLSLLKSHVTAFQKDVDEKELVINMLGQKLHEKDLILKKLALEKNLIKQKYSSQLVFETAEIAQKMQKQLKLQSELERHLKEKDKTLKQIRQILDIPPPGSHRPASRLKSSHSVGDISSGEITLGVDSRSQIETLRQPPEAWN